MKVMISRDVNDNNMFHVYMPYTGLYTKNAYYHFAAVHRDAINDIGGEVLIANLDEYKSGELIEVNLAITMED